MCSNLFEISECIPPSLRFFSGTEQVDLARKLQEDPLYIIKKKEMDSRSQLLKNPVKLKQIKQLVSYNVCLLNLTILLTLLPHDAIFSVGTAIKKKQS